MATGGLVLLLLLAGIALLVSRQVVLPVRSASRIAERFAEGHLSERMPVRGEDDMARLAVSFNDMAESLQRQITTLEEFGNLQRRFTSDVSHELRTPLTTVRMAADLIYDNSEDLDPALVDAAGRLHVFVNERQNLLSRFDRVERAGRQRRTDLLGDVTGTDLVAQAFDCLGGRSDPDDARRRYRARKIRILGEEAVAGVNRVGAGPLGGGDDLGNDEVGVGAGCAVQTDGFVSKPDVLCVDVLIGIDGDGGDSRVFRGADDANGDFTAVGDEDLGNAC
jgi:signal transduction histidine kinase